ncbi:MAG TPA: YlmC/YmxH family sporulation protein [Clostridia bacterium]|nr:YlmC/YmxH family sporulation protein [Clostridia bacterium]
MNVTFCELRSKDVVNVIDGKRMGRVVDLVFCCNGCKVLGIVVPNERRLFRCKDEIFIPWSHIQKIGTDVILVSLIPINQPCPSKGGMGGERGGGMGGKHNANCDYIIEDEY